MLSVVVPLAAALFLVFDDVSHHQSVRREATRIERAANQTKPLLNAQSGLSADMRAAAVVSSVSGLGLDLSGIVAALGLDLSTELGPARAILDEALIEISAAEREYWADPAAVDAFVTASEDRTRYHDLIDDMVLTTADLDRMRVELQTPLATATQAQISSLGVLALDVPRAGLLDDLAANAAAADAYLTAIHSQSASLVAYLVGFGLEDPAEAFAASYQASEVAWQRLAAGLDTTTLQRFEALRAEPDWVEFDALSEAIIAGELSSGPLEPTIRSIELGVTVSSFAADMTDQVIAQLGEEAALVSTEAAAQERRALVIGFVIAVVTLGSVGGAVTMIVRPLRHLEARAHQISAGDLEPTITARPLLREAAVIDEAMDDMVRSLSVIERQAEALSAGRLDASSLQESAPGRLGESLRQSVDQLSELTSRLDHQARHDILTGLPNRAAAMEAIDAALARRRSRGGQLGLLFVDLDEFKRINDDHGHAAGDAVLVETAARLVAQSRGRDVVARLGGDEFIALIDDVDDIDDAVEAAGRMARAMAEPMSVGGASITSTVSVGVALSDSSVITGEQLLHRADLAVYQAKALGRSRVEVFDDDLGEADDERRLLEHELREALAGAGLELWYQPIVDLPNHRVWGFEALLRWRTEDGGLRMPDQFIPLAEQSNLIVAVDDWVLSSAYETLGAWQADVETKDLHLAVNISSRNLTGGQLATGIRDGAPAGLDLSRLGLELTETGLLDDVDAAAATVHELQQLGIGVAIDDFGTGHSSVARLRGVPVNRLKVDRSYIAATEDASDRSILSTLASLAAALELEAVAEGVETAAQARLLASFGYTHAQGYHYARPMPLAEVGPWLAANDRADSRAG